MTSQSTPEPLEDVIQGYANWYHEHVSRGEMPNGRHVRDHLRAVVARIDDETKQLRRERERALHTAQSLVDDPIPPRLHLSDVIEKYVFRAGQNDGRAQAQDPTP